MAQQWQTLTLPVEAYVAIHGALEVEVVAWIPSNGERHQGKCIVPLADVREFGSLNGPFSLHRLYRIT